MVNEEVQHLNAEVARRPDELAPNESQGNYPISLALS